MQLVESSGKSDGDDDDDKSEHSEISDLSDPENDVAVTYNTGDDVDEGLKITMTKTYANTFTKFEQQVNNHIAARVDRDDRIRNGWFHQEEERMMTPEEKRAFTALKCWPDSKLKTQWIGFAKKWC